MGVAPEWLNTRRMSGKECNRITSVSRRARPKKKKKKNMRFRLLRAPGSLSIRRSRVADLSKKPQLTRQRKTILSKQPEKIGRFFQNIVQNLGKEEQGVLVKKEKKKMPP